MNASQMFVRPRIEHIKYVVTTLVLGEDGKQELRVWAGWNARQRFEAHKWAAENRIADKRVRMLQSLDAWKELLGPVLPPHLPRPEGTVHAAVLTDYEEEDIVGFFFCPSEVPAKKPLRLELPEGGFRMYALYPVCDLSLYSSANGKTPVSQIAIRL